MFKHGLYTNEAVKERRLLRKSTIPQSAQRGNRRSMEILASTRTLRKSLGPRQNRHRGLRLGGYKANDGYPKDPAARPARGLPSKTGVSAFGALT